MRGTHLGLRGRRGPGGGRRAGRGERAAAEQGAAILCASTDAEQLAAICHRVLIFSRGRVLHELSGADVSKEEIAERCYNSMRVDGLRLGGEGRVA